jgi:HEAT repeat protein
MTSTDAYMIAALAAENPSTRLNAALAIGSSPQSSHDLPADDVVATLIARCAVEPDFYVRDMLTWALTRFPRELVVPRLLAELTSDVAQARSQALHSLSKVKDHATFPAISSSLIRDSDDDVARSAWRAAVVLVPDERRSELATELATQFGRGDREVHLSLSRALVALGDEAIEPVLRTAMTDADPRVRAHAGATERLLKDPDAGFDFSVHEAKRQDALKGLPI